MKSNYLKQIISYKEIKCKIRNYSKQLIKILNNDSDNSIIFVNILIGSTPFFVDIIRSINSLGYKKHINIQYISASSYKNKVSNDLKIKHWINLDIKDKIIYLFEDVIDTGKTLTKIVDILKEQGAKTIKVISLTDKHEVHGKLDFEYNALFKVKSDFLVGYGLDCDEKFRQLRDICIYKN